MNSYTVKENPNGSAVSRILWYKQTNKQTNILLLYHKDLNWYTLFIKQNSKIKMAPILYQSNLGLLYTSQTYKDLHFSTTFWR